MYTKILQMMVITADFETVLFDTSPISIYLNRKWHSKYGTAATKDLRWETENKHHLRHTLLDIQ